MTAHARERSFDISINMLKTAKKSVDISKVELVAADGI
jgi:hypothetical protein